MDTDATGAIVTEFNDPPNDGHGNADSDTGGNNGTTNDGRINGYQTVEPGNAAGNSGNRPRTGKRGRPPGSKNGDRKAAAPTKNDIGAMENILLSVHWAVSVLLSAPELDINEDEAKKLATSVARISGMYSDKINAKAVAWIDLLSVGAALYGPRAVAIYSRMKTDAETTNPNRATPIVMPRPVPGKPAAQPTAARSPSELFGDVNFGANIPDAM